MKMYHSLLKAIRKANRGFLPVAMTLVMLVLAVGCGSGAAVTATQSNVYEVTRETYADRTISIHYPQISKMNDSEKQRKLNQILKAEALSILQDYGKGDLEKLTVKLDYVIGSQNSELLSVQFAGSRFLKGTPYPTALFQSINLEMQAGRKLRLQDIVQVDDKFVQYMRKGNINSANPNITWEKIEPVMAIDKLLKSLGHADSADANENPDRAFIYFTKDGMGVSVGLIHALGDHVEIEFPLTSVASFIKPDKTQLFK